MPYASTEVRQYYSKEGFGAQNSLKSLLYNVFDSISFPVLKVVGQHSTPKCSIAIYMRVRNILRDGFHTTTTALS